MRIFFFLSSLSHSFAQKDKRRLSSDLLSRLMS
jgi:hypothetical protein